MDKEVSLDSEDIINLIPLNKSTTDLAQKIINENNLEKIQDLTHLFNVNQAKKNAIRIIKLNSLLDTVSDQIIERFKRRPGEFSNSDLLNYMNVVQSSIDRASKALNLIDEAPAIQVNQVNINVQQEDSILSRDSRDKVTDAIKAILKKINCEDNESQEPIIIEPVIVQEDSQQLIKVENNNFDLIKGEEE